MGFWSPLNAMNAYMHTLQLCKSYYGNNDKEFNTNNSKITIQPEAVEFISALAAGNQAQTMVDISSSPTSPLTLALASAAKQTGGRLIILRNNCESIEEAKHQLDNFNLGEFAEYHCFRNSYEDEIKKFAKIDFAVIDHRIEGCPELFAKMDMNPRGSVVVVSNLIMGRRSYAQAVKGGSNGVRVDSMMLPIGSAGLEITRIHRSSASHEDHATSRNCKRSCRRRYVILEE